MALFDTTKVALIDLLKEVEKAEIQLPDFQRGWVWDDDGIRGLLASISLSFPIGAIMLLEAGGDLALKPRLLEGVPPSGERRPERFLLDGQQRLTSLYQATMRAEAIATRNTQKRTISRHYYIDIRKALDGTASRDDAILGVPEDRILRSDFGRTVDLDLSSREREYEEWMFPTCCVFDDQAWVTGFQTYWSSRPGADLSFFIERQNLYQQFKTGILAAFQSYHVPVITLAKETSKEAVCLVFEKVNTGGKKLDSFELLTAIFAASGYELRRDWYGDKLSGEPGRRGRLAKHDVLAELQSTDFLQAVSLLVTLERRDREIADGKQGKALRPVSCNRDAILSLPLDGYQRWADKAEAGFVKAAQFLHAQSIFWRKDVPYPTQLVPLAAAIVRLDDRWHLLSVKEKVARWFWCGVLGELYGSAVETRFARDLVELPVWLDGGARPSTVVEARFSQERFATLRSRLSAAYKGVHALLMKHGARDFLSGAEIGHVVFWEEKIDIHHIFPKAWCTKARRGGFPRARYDSVVNKSPIGYKPNRMIGAKAPSQYLPALRAKLEIDRDDYAEVLRSHLLDPTLLEQDDALAFWADREARLIGLIEEAMDKPVVRASGLDEPIGELAEEEDELDAAEEADAGEVPSAAA